MDVPLLWATFKLSSQQGNGLSDRDLVTFEALERAAQNEAVVQQPDQAAEFE